ncbi:MAG: DUF3027 domain-containing protein [Sporichthyaceae bacterium]|nr:DUF3027 domain-containing protein [Sporichthyaceae bacterium]
MTGTTSTRTARPSRTVPLDAQCAAAIDLARAVAVESTDPDQVGDHLEAVAEDERVVTHYFACLAAGYRGWRWAVTVARASRARLVTVDEVVLLPGNEAILAPEWVPWSDRLRPGDLGAGDLLPTLADDLRLEPGYTGADEDLAHDGNQPPVLPYELGLDRIRVLSRYGIQDAAERWYAGEAGPDSPVARAAPAHCRSCGFLVAIGGSLGRMFGVCANEYSPSDGQVVAFDHGCGAHSEAVTGAPQAEPEPPIIDEFGYDELGGEAAVLLVARPQPEDERPD